MGGEAAGAEVLVSADTADDAAVIRLPGGGCLVQTVDFFTPIVDDPVDWGRVAAANALSDVYAMGARPAFALNIAGWPRDEIPVDVLAEVLRGGIELAKQEAVAVVGGHTIDAPEPTYGMAVTGFVAEEDLVRNSTAAPGAMLVLTKPLGIGILTTAIKRGSATEEDVQRVVALMTTTNRAASEAMVEVGVQAATDVTGFGLLGHLREMTAASGVAAQIDAGAVPLLARARELATAEVVPGGTRRNHSFLRNRVDWGDLDSVEQLVLADAQTSGGLLVAVEEDRVGAFLEALSARSVEGAVIGRATDSEPGHIAVRGRLS